MKTNKIGFFVILCVILSDLLYPYAINSLTSSASTIVSIIYFFNLTCFSYFLGRKAKENNDYLYKISIFYFIFNLICNIINYNNGLQLLEPFYTTKILLCFIIWSLIAKYFTKKIYIPLFTIIALLIGFYPEINTTLSLSWLISLFPFFLIGYNIDYELKWKNWLKVLIGIILFITIIGVIVFILKRFYVSYDILLLKPYLAKKHLIFRFGVFALSIMMIIALNLICSTNRFKLIEKFGNNAIISYALLPIFSLLFSKLVDVNYYNNYYIIYAFIATILVLILTANNFLRNIIDKIFKKIKNNSLITISIIILAIICLAIPKLKVNYINYPIYEKMSEKEINDIDNAVSISFVGDLILLENQIKSAYNGSNYNFDRMFEYSKKYLEQSDLAIGVLEGPVANGDYTIGNFDDGVELHLNYPKSFLTSIKNSGIDLVSTANNHLLDMGVIGANDTIDALANANLDYVGSLNNKYKILEVEGLKIAVLAYTYGANYYTEDELIKLDITSVIVDPSSKNFNKVKQNVIKDFQNVKSMNVDLIVVIPHMGTQFSHETDVFQNTWNKIFVENGASIIFGDHSHAVQPIEYVNDTIIINSPGNFANQYTLHDGDATSIVEVYVDKSTKKIVASSVIPMYTQANNDGFFRALPIYDIMNNDILYNSISSYEMTRIKDVHSLITKVMLNQNIDIDNIEEKYYFFKNGYKRNEVNNSSLTIIDTPLTKKINNSQSICFIGDSVTEGTRNGGYGWYEPLMSKFNTKVNTVAYGSYTTKLLLQNKENELKNCNSDLYIIAIGTNDIRYRDASECAMTSKEYITNIEKILSIITKENKNAEFVFIAPWFSLKSDNVSVLNHEDKLKLINEYSQALAEYSLKNNHLFINPNALIEESLKAKNSNYYMKDFIHPNKTKGIELYSWAVLEASKI